jgi:hypothetical protein
MTDTETRPVLLVCGCQKYRPYLEATVRRFAKHSEWRVVGLLGNPTATAPVFDGTYLTVPNPDTYEALPAKIQAAVAWIAATWPDVPGYFKTDDDIEFGDIHTLIASILGLKDSHPYWGLTYSICRAAPVNTWRIQNRFSDTSLRPTHQTAVYCFGAGYWIGREGIRAIAAAADVFAASALEDVATGFVMNRAGFHPQKLPLPVREVPRGPELLALQ